MDRIINHYLDLVDYQRLTHYMQHLKYRFITLLPNDLVAICALKTDSYLFDNILMLLPSISLICCSVVPKYYFELPDRKHVISLSLLYLTSFSSISCILVSVFFLRPLLDLVSSKSTFFSRLVN